MCICQIQDLGQSRSKSGFSQKDFVFYCSSEYHISTIYKQNFERVLPWVGFLNSVERVIRAKVEILTTFYKTISLL